MTLLLTNFIPLKRIYTAINVYFYKVMENRLILSKSVFIICNDYFEFNNFNKAIVRTIILEFEWIMPYRYRLLFIVQCHNNLFKDMLIFAYIYNFELTLSIWDIAMKIFILRPFNVICKWVFCFALKQPNTTFYLEKKHVRTSKEKEL